MTLDIDDDAWFELQLRPEDAHRECGIVLPALPPDEVQLGFTARCGRDNLQQAFNFYRHVSAVCKLAETPTPRILDFGGGWGRIARFFLRDTTPDRITIADCMGEAVHWLNATGNPCRIIKNDPRPPIAGLGEPLDLIYAFSVFSHLSEEYFHAWVDYLMGQLRPGGCFVFTTRGMQFIEQLDRLRREDSTPRDVLRHYQALPDAGELRRRYVNGEFQFYPLWATGELGSDFFGETFIPRAYIEPAYGPCLIEFTEDVPQVDQSIVVFQKSRSA
jgi:hypothetical protein